MLKNKPGRLYVQRIIAVVLSLKTSTRYDEGSKIWGSTALFKLIEKIIFYLKLLYGKRTSCHLYLRNLGSTA